MARGAGTDRAEVAEQGHQNLITYSAALAGWSDQGALHEADGVVAFASGTWLPVGANGAFRRTETVAAGDVVAVADEFFRAVGRGYSIKVRDSGVDDDLTAACAAGGLAEFESAPQMAYVGGVPLPEVALPAGVVLRAVGDAAGVADFALVNAEAYATYGMPGDVIGDVVARADVVIGDPRLAMVVAYRETGPGAPEPLATALVFVSDGTASVQWVGVRPAARGLRLGAAVTVWVTNEALARGVPSCTLQASTMGESLYRKLGYTTLYRYVEHVRWTAEGPGPPTGG